MNEVSIFVFETELGAVHVRVDARRTPLTVAYVRQLIESGAYDGAAFYRTTKLGNDARRSLIQGGLLTPVFTGSGDPIPSFDALETVESTDASGYRHERGTVSLARDLFSSGNVLPELFVCLDDYPDLDRGGRTEPDDLGFPAFGSVVEGLEVADAIGGAEAEGVSRIEHLAGELLSSPVAILRATVTDPPDVKG